MEPLDKQVAMPETDEAYSAKPEKVKPKKSAKAKLKEAQKELPRIEKCVEQAHDYFSPNYTTYKFFNNFVYNTTLDDADRAVLSALGKPELEFNTMSAYGARLLGEFEKHEPSVEIQKDPSATTEITAELLEVLDGHVRHVIDEANKNSFQYECVKNIISGGFGASRLWTEYANSMSFEQVIRLGNIPDPTLTYWDPLARLPHKGDGKYNGFLYPKLASDFKKEHPEIDMREIKFVRGVAGFNWAYNNQRDDILLVCEHFEKKIVPTTIAYLSNRRVILENEYEQFVEEWMQSNPIEMPPIIVRTRETQLTKICRYVFIKGRILEYIETDYKSLPIVFGDGDSRLIHKSGNIVFQKTRPYFYNLQGNQKLKNLAGQSLANELENITQQKIQIIQEALPDEPDYIMAYTAPQLPSVLVSKGFKDNDPNVPLPPPQTIARQPIPPELVQTFLSAEQTTQALLGSYDAEMGIADKGLSGKAIQLGSINSNSAAKPFLIGYLQMLERLIQNYIELLPYFYTTPRTIPILTKEGERSFVTINQEGGIKFDYTENDLKVTVKAGPSFATQKAMALQQIIMLTQASPIFAEFINMEGLETILDNLDLKGVELLKEKAQKFVQEKQQQAQAQMQMAQQAQQNNPQLIKAQNERMKIEMDAKQAETDSQLKVAQLMLDEEKVENEKLNILSHMNIAQAEAQASEMRSHAEERRAAVDMAIKVADMSHQHHRETRELHHKITAENRKNQQISQE